MATYYKVRFFLEIQDKDRSAVITEGSSLDDDAVYEDLDFVSANPGEQNDHFVERVKKHLKRLIAEKVTDADFENLPDLVFDSKGDPV